MAGSIPYDVWLPEFLQCYDGLVIEMEGDAGGKG